jgi:hypothetical protein
MTRLPMGRSTDRQRGADATSNAVILDDTAGPINFQRGGKPVLLPIIVPELDVRT